MTAVLVVTPTYNERENITKLIQGVREALTGGGYSYHVLVVDDSSPDGTAEVVEELAKEDGRIHLLKRSGKLGLGSAYIDGFKWALSNLDFDILVQMDADLSHPPRDTLRLADAVLKGADVAVASRYIEGGGSAKWPWHRRLISWGANLLAHILLGLEVKDVTSGFKAMSRGAVQSLLRYRLSSKGYSYQFESLVVFRELGLKVEEVPFTFEQRRSGKAKLSTGEIFRFSASLLRLAFSGVKRKESR